MIFDVPDDAYDRFMGRDSGGVAPCLRRVRGGVHAVPARLDAGAGTGALTTDAAPARRRGGGRGALRGASWQAMRSRFPAIDVRRSTGRGRCRGPTASLRRRARPARDEPFVADAPATVARADASRLDPGVWWPCACGPDRRRPSRAASSSPAGRPRRRQPDAVTAVPQRARSCACSRGRRSQRAGERADRGRGGVRRGSTRLDRGGRRRRPDARPACARSTPAACDRPRGGSSRSPSRCVHAGRPCARRARHRAPPAGPSGPRA